MITALNENGALFNARTFPSGTEFGIERYSWDRCVGLWLGCTCLPAGPHSEALRTILVHVGEVLEIHRFCDLHSGQIVQRVDRR